MKKTLSLILALVMILSLCACGGTKEESKAPESQAPASTAPEKAPESTAPEAPKWEGNINVQVAASAGGGTDVVARTLAQWINENTDANLTIVNNTDGGGVVAYETVRNAKPDGKTILFFHTTMCIKHASGIYEHNPAEEFAVISTSMPKEKGSYVMIVPADGPFKTLDDFIAEAKANPGSLKLGVETGGSSHIMSGSMAQAAGIDVQYVEAGPDTEKMTALVGGSIDGALVNPNTAKQYIEANKVTPLAAVSADAEGSRIGILPDVPSFIEQGVNFTFATNFFVLGPKDMDPALMEIINAAYVAAAADSDTDAILAKAGFAQDFMSIEDSKVFITDLQNNMNTVVDALGLKQ